MPHLLFFMLLSFSLCDHRKTKLTLDLHLCFLFYRVKLPLNILNFIFRCQGRIQVSKNSKSDGNQHMHTINVHPKTTVDLFSCCYHDNTINKTTKYRNKFALVSCLKPVISSMTNQHQIEHGQVVNL